MPIYEYRCQACGHELEALQFMNEDPLVECPECGESQLKRKVSAAAFRLKGSGWYETDFKKDKRRNVAGDGESRSSGKSGDGASGGESGGKSAEKPAASKEKTGGSADKKSAAGK